MRYVLSLLTFLAVFGASVAAEPLTISRAAWSSDGAYLVTTGPERKIRVHDGNSGQLIKEVTAPGDLTTYVSFSPDSGTEEANSLNALAVSGQYALTGSTDGALHWWSLPDLMVAQQTTIDYQLQGLSLARDGKVAAYTDTSTRYLDSNMALLRWLEAEVSRTSFRDLPPPDSSQTFGVPRLSPNGAWAIALVSDQLRLWSLEQPEPSYLELSGGTPFVMGDAHFYATEADTLTQYAYTATEKALQKIPLAGSKGIALDGKETRLVVLAPDAVLIWDLTRPGQSLRWSKTAESLTLSPDGKKLGLWQEDRMDVWSLDTEKLLFSLARPR